jgi:hypothetical protein
LCFPGGPNTLQISAATKTGLTPPNFFMRAVKTKKEEEKKKPPLAWNDFPSTRGNQIRNE